MGRERERRERLQEHEEIRRERRRRHQRLRRDAGRAEGRGREIRRGEESRREDGVFSGRKNRIGKFGAYKQLASFIFLGSLGRVLFYNGMKDIL